MLPKIRNPAIAVIFALTKGKVGTVWGLKGLANKKDLSGIA